MNYRPNHTCQIPALNQHYLDLFGYKTSGLFVEVGALDGESTSNTDLLADIGWTGIYIEPIEEFAAKCSDRHKTNNVTVETIAVSTCDDVATIHVMHGGLSTMSVDVLDELKTIEWSAWAANIAKPRTVNTTTLTSILHKHNVASCFDLLVIDVEGSEHQVLTGLDVSIFRPRVIIVEINRNFKYVTKTSELIYLWMKAHYYREYWFDDINSIFIDDTQYNTGEEHAIKSITHEKSVRSSRKLVDGRVVVSFL